LTSHGGGGHGLHYTPMYIKPRPRQAWVDTSPDSGQYIPPKQCESGAPRLVSSLTIVNEERVATDSDLVLDLVYVIILAHLGRIFRDRAIEFDDPAWVSPPCLLANSVFRLFQEAGRHSPLLVCLESMVLCIMLAFTSGIK
jgi:hypothetical protein